MRDWREGGGEGGGFVYNDGRGGVGGVVCRYLELVEAVREMRDR